MITLTVKRKKIERIPLDSGEEIWIWPQETAFYMLDGLYVGLRASLIRNAFEQKVKTIRVPVEGRETIETNPAEIIARAVLKEVPAEKSYFNKSYGMYYLPI